MSFALPRVVYVVDDDDDIRQALCLGLRRRGLFVEDFSSAQSFLDEYDGYEPAVLLLDVEMPGMNGLALQAEVVRRGYRLPIVFVSASTDPRHRQQAEADGAEAFLSKLTPVDELEKTIRNAFSPRGVLPRKSFVS